MRIVHYIENISNQLDASARFVSMLGSAMPPTVETTIISGKPSRKEILRILYQVNPDVVHIHGCWSYYASRLQTWCRSRGYSVVIMPHGGLMSNQMQTEYWKQKLPRILLYQLRSIKRSTVLIASTTKELNELKQLGWRKRIALVRNPYATDDVKTTIEDSAETLLVLYQKIIDTNERLKLSRLEEKLFTIINFASLVPVKDSPELSVAYEGELQEYASRISALEWKHIILTAKDRGIEDAIANGAAALRLQYPDYEIEVPSRFLPKLQVKIRVNHGYEKVLAKHFDINVYRREYALACLFYVLYLRLEKMQCESDKYRIWFELNTTFKTLRLEEYDEDVLQKMLRRLHITSFTRRMMQILSESHLLTEGFMPVTPLDDYHTEKLRKTIYTQQ